jgi:glutamate-1-semialdehyde aminotransferase
MVERNPPLSDINHRQDVESGQELWELAKQLIPGGSQLLSKRSEMFAPDQWPSFYQSASGVSIEALNGRQYTDMSIMGVGSCILGYSDDDVNERVHDVVDKGSMTTLNAPEEVELAELLLDIHPWADMVRYGRAGGETMTIAVRLARAATNNSTVAFCGYHGWHDWYLAANLEGEEKLESHLLPGLDPTGVPDELEGTAKPFEYNDIQELERIVDENDMGAIVVEPIRYKPPNNNFIERVAEIADENGIPLIFDEITAGFRLRTGGAHEQFDVTPDIVVYGKAMANGYPMGAVVGKEWVMDKAQESFISSTFWTERIGPVAALETIRKIDREDVPSHLVRIGNEIMDGWEQLAEEHGIHLKIKTREMPPLATFAFEHSEQSQAASTLFTQEMLDHGYLAGSSVYVSYSHTERHVEEYLSAVDDVFDTIATHLQNETVTSALDGPVAHTKFERLN